MMSCEEVSALVARASARFACFAFTEISHDPVCDTINTSDVRGSLYNPTSEMIYRAVYSRKVAVLSLDRSRQICAMEAPKHTKLIKRPVLSRTAFAQYVVLILEPPECYCRGKSRP